MSFVSPSLLLGLFLLVPALIAFLVHRRREVLRVPSVLLFRLAARSASPTRRIRKLRRLLALLACLGALADALVFASARPRRAVHRRDGGGGDRSLGLDGRRGRALAARAGAALRGADAGLGGAGGSLRDHRRRCLAATSGRAERSRARARRGARSARRGERRRGRRRGDRSGRGADPGAATGADRAARRRRGEPGRWSGGAPRSAARAEGLRASFAG